MIATAPVFYGLETFDHRWIERGRERLNLTDLGFVAEGFRIHVPILEPEINFLYEDQPAARWGFTNDGGTIPRPAWVVVGHPFSDLFPAFVLHDYAWSFRTTVGLSFGQSNDMLYAACRALGASKARAWSIYTAVSGITARAMWRRGERYSEDVAYHYAPIGPVTWRGLGKN